MPEEGRVSIRGKLFSIVLFPVILLSIVITIAAVVSFYGFYTQSIRDELVSTTNMMFDCLDLADRGDYVYEDDMLLKGNLQIADFTMLRRLKEKSQIDTTIFWGDTRILTTVEDEHGNLAVGTKANEEVANTVLKEGKSIFLNNLDIGGKRYIGYYMPVQNSDNEIVGMMFAGKQKGLVYQKITKVVLRFAVFSILTMVISILITKNFSASIISDINLINEYLKNISEGDLRCQLDEKIINRKDELGTIGLYASAMREELQKLVEMDPLTDLYNRRSAHNLLEIISQSEEAYCAVMCDIDLFKKVNDNYGHAVGDYVLVEISRLLRENVKGAGFACRWGGEEFLLIYKLDFEHTKAKTEQLQQSIRDFAFCYQDIGLDVSMTFGIAQAEKDVSFEEVIKVADEKLYIGKKNGRDQIVA